MFKERKSFVVAALSLIAVFWITLFSSFVGNCVRDNFKDSSIVSLINFILTGIGLGFAIFFFVKNKFEVNDSVVALVVITAVVYVVLSITSSCMNTSNVIDGYKGNLKTYEELKQITGNDYSASIKVSEDGITTSVTSLIFTIIEKLVLVALVLFSNEPKKTFEKVVGFFKGLFGKKPAAKTAAK